MKAKVAILSFIIAIQLFAVVPVRAQTPSGIPIAGKDCGLTTSPANKCCYYDKTQENIPLLRPDLGILSGILNPIFDWLQKAVIQVLGPTKGELIGSYNDTEQPCIDGQPSTPGEPQNANCICIKKADTSLDALKPLCANIQSGSERNSCLACLSGDPVGVWTGMGCIKANVQSFIQDTLLSWGVGLAGGVSMLCIIYSAFMMQTSGGNAEKVKKAQQLLTACITGLMLIIFSVLILRIIGVGILRIPGFS